jgi:hypothetical protein
MSFEAIVDQAIDMVRRRGRVTYRMLKAHFSLDDELLEALKEELLYGQRLAVDEDNNVLVWVGETADADPTSGPTTAPALTPTPSPLAYTPAYLTEKILTSRSALEGERKHVTVLFADLKDSTELIKDLDPEAAQQLLDPAIHIMMDAVHRFEGTVNQVLGDGIMALFGAPLAHEDHAARACYAALAMQTAMRDHTEAVRRQQGLELRLRVGLNSGEHAGQGHGQVVAAVGEAGVGKSRLVYEFVHSRRTQGWRVLESASVSYGKATPYLPVVDLLKRYIHAVKIPAASCGAFREPHQTSSVAHFEDFSGTGYTDE